MGDSVVSLGLFEHLLVYNNVGSCRLTGTPKRIAVHQKGPCSAASPVPVSCSPLPTSTLPPAEDSKQVDLLAEA